MASGPKDEAVHPVDVDLRLDDLQSRELDYTKLAEHGNVGLLTEVDDTDAFVISQFRD